MLGILYLFFSYQRSQLEDKSVFRTPFHVTCCDPTPDNAQHFGILPQRLDFHGCSPDDNSQLLIKPEVSMERSRGSQEGYAWLFY